MRALVATVFVTFGILLGGWEPARAAEQVPPANAKCPVLTDEDVDRDVWVEHQGKKVYFCCQKCRMQFLANPAPYLKNLPQFAGAPDRGTGAPAVADHDAGTADDHSSDHAAGPAHPRWHVFLGNLHPVAVHFPIALILCAMLCEMIFVLTSRSVFSDTARVIIVLGAVTGIGAALLGWFAAEHVTYPADLLRVLWWHRAFGIATVVLGAAAALASEVSRRPVAAGGWRLAYRLLLLAAAILVGITGFLGGTLVYGPDHFAW
jgi:uncharacterized membrane protein